MANFEVPEKPEFNNQIRKLEESDPAHANLFNAIIEALLNNELFLKKVQDALAESLKEHLENETNPHNVTKEQVGVPQNAVFTDTTYEVFKAPNTSGIGAKAGLVPAPTVADIPKVLGGGGSWVPANEHSHDGYASSNHTHTASDVGLENVNNTADKDKNVKSATQLGLRINIPSDFNNAIDGLTIIDTAANVTIANGPLGTKGYHGFLFQGTYVASNGALLKIQIFNNGTEYIRHCWYNTWSAWRTMVHDANYSSYVVPKTGGTFTGGINVPTIELYSSYPFIDFHFNNSSSDYTSRIIENASGHLNINGVTFQSGIMRADTLRGGDKVQIWSDNEGGSIRLVSPNSNNTYYEMDVLGGNLRIYKMTEGNYSNPFTLTNDTLSVNNLYTTGQSQINNMLITKVNDAEAMSFKMGAKNNTNNASYPCLWFRQFSNTFQFFPNNNNGDVCIGHQSYKFAWVYANNIYNSSGVITTSDRNKKHDIKDLESGFVENIIDGLSAKSFKYNDGSSGRIHFGIIAQDLEDLLKELGISSTDFAPLVKDYPDKEVEIGKDEEGNPIIELQKDYDAEPTYNVRYEEFIMILVKYCQGLKEENLKLRENFNALEKRLEALENKINRRN